MLGDAGAAGDASTVSGALVDEVPSGDSSILKKRTRSACLCGCFLDQGDVNAVAAALPRRFSEAKVFIQDTKDKDNSWPPRSRVRSLARRFGQNMYDEDEDFHSTVLPTRRQSPAPGSHAWLAGTTVASSNVADTMRSYNEQSLTVTDAMVGTICKVTADGKDYYGPSVSYGFGH